MTETSTATGLRDDWQAGVKRYFIIPVMLVNLAVIVVGVVGGWWGPVIAASGQFLLFGFIGVKRRARASAAPVVVLSGAGVVLSFTESTTAVVLAIVAFALLIIYVVWYSRNQRSPSPALAIGAALPPLEFTDLDGRVVATSEWRGGPTVLLFYRGTWCPLCSVQVRDLADRYREIEQLGARAVLVSPQAATESAKLAARFDAPMTFLVDEGNRAARRLGIQHPGGAPVGVSPQGESVLPTAVVIDAEGIVRFAHETDNYRFRPDPALFLDALRRLPSA